MTDTSASLQPHAEEPSARPLRADARRNRALLLSAARDVFSEQGRDAQIDDVARRAGLGVGTVYRHFPTKEALLEALAIDKFERLHAMASEALASDDAGEAFMSILWSAAEQMQCDRALSEAISEEAFAGALEQRAKLNAAGAELLRRAQAAGAVREDVEPEDLPVIMCSLAAAVRRGSDDPQRWKRYVELVCDGLRR